MDHPKVLVVSGLYPNSYKEYDGTFIHGRAKQLALSGCQVQVFTVEAISCGTYLRSPRDVWHFYCTPKRFTYEWDGITVQGIRCHLGLPSRYSVNEWRTVYRAVKQMLVQVIEKGGYDIMQIATGGSLASAASRIAVEMSIPYLACAYGTNINKYYNKPQSGMHKVQLPLLLDSELVICVSDDLNKKVKEMTDGQCRTFTFYSGVDTSAFHKSPSLREQYRRRFSYTEQDRVLLFIGHLIRAKGIYELLHVIPCLQERFEKVRLLIVGAETAAIDGWRIRRTVKRLGIESSVMFTGGVNNREIRGYMNAADLFVFPSWQEGMPNSVMEACACELPVIASRVGGIPELIADGVTGVLIYSRSNEELYQAIARQLESPGVARSYGVAAREKVVKKFNYHRNGRLLAEKIREIVDAPRQFPSQA